MPNEGYKTPRLRKTFYSEGFYTPRHHLTNSWEFPSSISTITF